MSSPNSPAPVKKTAEIAIDTPTHFIESNIDPKYQWNEWEVRKKVIQTVPILFCLTSLKVDLQNKKTHSTQTGGSHFRRENHSQHYAPKYETLIY
jgi:hypothetical protein